jgi:hypothetical protein
MYILLLHICILYFNELNELRILAVTFLILFIGMLKTGLNPKAP